MTPILGSHLEHPGECPVCGAAVPFVRVGRDLSGCSECPPMSLDERVRLSVEHFEGRGVDVPQAAIASATSAPVIERPPQVVPTQPERDRESPGRPRKTDISRTPPPDEMREVTRPKR